MAIKLIALDLDGTTLNSDNVLTEKTKESLIKAAEQGIEIVPVTGRCYYSLPKEIKQLGECNCIRYVITSNGAEIRDLKQGDILYDNYIDESGVKEIKSALKKSNRMVEVYVKGKAYIERSDYEKIRKGEVSYRNREYVLETRSPVRGVKQLLDVHSHRIEKVAVYFSPNISLHKIEEEFISITNARVTSSGKNTLEFIGKNCNKAKTLKQLCGMLEIEFSEIMAFGDSFNDFEMLELVGISVAMGNAETQIKENASYITATNDCDGVAIAINNKLLQCV